MTIIKAILLGFIQGITEFLPISSSAHLMLAETLMGLKNDLCFSLILHFATLLAVVMYYWKELVNIIKNPKSKMAKMLYVSFLPTVIIALIIKKSIEEYEIIGIIGLLFIATAIILILPKIIKKRARLGVSKSTGVIVGIVQGMACIPGISRSGATITAGVFCGLNHEDAVKFSFLLSIPIIIGGILAEIIFDTQVVINSIMGVSMIIGFLVAFVTGVISIKLINKIIIKDKFYIFSIYLCIIGVLCVINGFYPII